jgi:rubredoxin
MSLHAASGNPGIENCAESIQVIKPAFVVTIVCPVCHTPISNFERVVKCAHCGVVFEIRTAQAKPGPAEYKA